MAILSADLHIKIVSDDPHMAILSADLHIVISSAYWNITTDLDLLKYHPRICIYAYILKYYPQIYKMKYYLSSTSMQRKNAILDLQQKKRTNVIQFLNEL